MKPVVVALFDIRSKGARAGLQRPRAQGTRLGRKQHRIPDGDLDRTAHLSSRNAAKKLVLPSSLIYRARAFGKPVRSAPNFRDSANGLESVATVPSEVAENAS
jgi:hypothetical protein